MIPPRTFNGENPGLAVHYRVSACRRRLRVSRSSHRPIANPLRNREMNEIENSAAVTLDPTRLKELADAQEETEST